MSRLTNYFSVTPVNTKASPNPYSEQLLDSDGFKPGVYHVPVKKSAIGVCVFNSTHQHLRIDIINSSIPSDIILNMSSMWEIYSKIINNCENSFFIDNLSKIFQVKLFDEAGPNGDFKIVNGINGEVIRPRQYLVITVHTSNDNNKLFGLFILSQLNTFRFDIVCNGEAFTLMENSLAQNFEVAPRDVPPNDVADHEDNIEDEWLDPDGDTTFFDLIGNDEKNDDSDDEINVDNFENYKPLVGGSINDIESTGNSSDSDIQIMPLDTTSPYDKYRPYMDVKNVDSVSEASTTNSLNRNFVKMKVNR